MMVAINGPWQLGSNHQYVLLQTVSGYDTEDPFLSISSVY